MNVSRRLRHLVLVLSLNTGIVSVAFQSSAQSPPTGGAESEQAANEEIEQVLDEATSEVARGDCGSALPRLQSVLSSSAEIPKALYLLGFCQAAQGQAEPALATLDKLVALKPGFPGLRLLRGQVLRVVGRTSDAEAELKAQIETGNDPLLLPDAWFTLGVVYRDSGRRTEALSAFEQVAAIAPHRTDAILEVADLHLKLDQLDRAEEALERARQAGASTAAALLNLGVAHYNKKDFTRAASFFSRVIEMGGTPQDLGVAYGLLGKSQLRMGDATEATVSFKKSIELDPRGRLAEDSRKHLEDLAPTGKRK